MIRTIGNTGNTKMCADGMQSSMPTVPKTTTGNYAQTISDNENGHCGQCLFPARLDHSHPLNVLNSGLQSMSAGGVTDSYPESFNLADHIKPFGVTGSDANNATAPISCGVSTTATNYATVATSWMKRCIGRSKYYARADHSHPIPVDTGTVTSSSEKSGYGVVTVANVSSNCSLPTDISNQRNNADGNSLRYAKSSLFNLQTYPKTFSVNCCTRVVTYGKDNYFFFRTFTFNKWGLLQSVGGENSYCKCMITS